MTGYPYLIIFLVPCTYEGESVDVVFITAHSVATRLYE